MAQMKSVKSIYLPVMLTLLIVSGFFVAAPQAFATTTIYTATITPTTAFVNQSIPFTITVTNDPSSTTTGGIRQITIQLPAGFGTPTVGATTVTCSPTCSKTWNTPTISGGLITITATSLVASNELKKGDSIQIPITSISPSDPSTYTWTTLAYPNATNTNGPYTLLVGATQPTVIVSALPDTTPPVIAPHGDVTAEATSVSGASVIYTSPTTSDNVDSVGTATCLTVSGGTFALGSTIVTCNATDVAGNHATPTTFSVIVQDTTAPVISLTGSSLVNLHVGDSYSDASATALDNIDGDITANIIMVNPVNTAVPGTYSVTYDVSDAHGNHAAHVTRTVHVDAPIPVVSTETITAPVTSSAHNGEHHFQRPTLSVPTAEPTVAAVFTTITNPEIAGQIIALRSQIIALLYQLVASLHAQLNAHHS